MSASVWLNLRRSECDSGLVHALLGIQTPDRLSGHRVAGTSWEGFVLETFLAALSWRSQPLFYRTIVGAEIDLLIERTDGKLWAVESKRSLSAKLGRVFYQAREDLKPERAFAVHAGSERFPLAEGIEAIGLRDLASLVAQDI